MGSGDRPGDESLRHTAALLSAAEEIAGLGSWEWDLHTGVQRWSAGMARLLGSEAETREPGLATLLAFVAAADRERVAAVHAQAGRPGVVRHARFGIERGDGAARTLEGTWSAIRDRDTGAVTVIATLRDVTDEVLVQDRLQAAEEDRAREARTRRLQQITDAALAALPLDELITELLTRVCEALPAAAAALLLAEPPADTLVLRATHGLAEEVEQTRMSSARGLAARVAQRRAAVVLTGSDISELQVTALREMGAVAGVPLLVGPEMIGVLEVGRRDRAPFAGDDLALLQLAADRTALSLDHGRIFDRERNIAQTLQRSLLPGELPVIPGVELETRFLPVRHGEGQGMGGDFYDVTALGRGRWLLVLGDVCGKGVEAAALTAMVRYTLRAEAIHEPRPGELLGLLNDAMLAQRSDLAFCTAACIVLDTSVGRPWMTIATGGHPMPLIMHADGTIEPASETGGPLVGVWADAEFPDVRRRLAPGDTLIAYTDGLLEAHAPEQLLTPMELAEIAARLPSRPLPEFLRSLENIALGAAAMPVRDDIAILAVAVDGAAERRPAGTTSQIPHPRSTLGGAGEPPGPTGLTGSALGCLDARPGHGSSAPGAAADGAV